MKKMGIFDSKQVKEEKRIYQALLAIKDTSYLLKQLPKTEKEFLSSQYKVRYINIHKYALEIMKDNEITQAFHLTTLGMCCDFVDRYYNEYILAVERKRTDLDFMTYLKNAISPELAIKEAEKQVAAEKQQYAKRSIEIDRGIDYLEAQIQQMNTLPGAIRTNNMVSDAANDFASKMSEKDFKEKFPEYTELQALILRDSMGIISPEQKQIITDIIAKGKNYDPEFMLDDIVLPYLIERAGMGILSSSEQKLYNEKTVLEHEILRKKNTYITFCYH